VHGAVGLVGGIENPGGEGVEERFIQFVIPAIGLVSGLIGAYVGLQNRVLLAEVRKEIAELENRLIEKINGTYVRRGECELRELMVHDKLTALASEMRSRTAAEE
jgi:hypothetical protein